MLGEPPWLASLLIIDVVDFLQQCAVNLLGCIGVEVDPKLMATANWEGAWKREKPNPQIHDGPIGDYLYSEAEEA